MELCHFFCLFDVFVLKVCVTLRQLILLLLRAMAERTRGDGVVQRRAFLPHYGLCY